MESLVRCFVVSLLVLAGTTVVGCVRSVTTPGPTSTFTASPTSTSTLTHVPTTTPAPDGETRFRLQRERMVAEDIEPQGITDPLVLDAMRTVPRHLFVPEKFRDWAYHNRPLPIGEGQTISQPHIVGLMSQLLDVKPGEKVLEVGTGSGYQAAVLAEMDVEVYSIEIIPTLAHSAKERLARLGYTDIQTRIGDGYFGWEEEALFDGIIVTAAPDHVPPPLLSQLKPTGKMVIPVGPPGSVQTLWLVEQREGEWVFLNQGRVIFVPLGREPEF